MTKGRESKDGRAVPEGRRKAVPTEARPRGGKATTASEQARQLELFPETAARPKPGATKSTFLPAMTMEEVADAKNLREAFKRVEENDGAPGRTGRAWGW